MLGDNLFSNGIYPTMPTMNNDLIRVNGIEGARAKTAIRQSNDFN